MNFLALRFLIRNRKRSARASKTCWGPAAEAEAPAAEGPDAEAPSAESDAFSDFLDESASEPSGGRPVFGVGSAETLEPETDDFSFGEADSALPDDFAAEVPSFDAPEEMDDSFFDAPADEAPAPPSAGEEELELVNRWATRIFPSSPDLPTRRRRRRSF